MKIDSRLHAGLVVLAALISACFVVVAVVLTFQGKPVDPQIWKLAGGSFASGLLLGTNPNSDENDGDTSAEAIQTASPIQNDSSKS